MQYQLDFNDILFPQGEPRLSLATSTDSVRDSIITAFYNGVDAVILEKMIREGYGLTDTRP